MVCHGEHQIELRFTAAGQAAGVAIGRHDHLIRSSDVDILAVH